MVQYNRDLLKKYASRLYQQADILAVLYTIAGGVVGSLRATVFNAQNPRKPADEANLVFWCFLVGFALIGLLLGLSRGFQLKVRAQEILCQVAIEENTSARMPAKY